MTKLKNILLLGILAFIVSGCSTWKTYDKTYNESNGIATLNIRGINSAMFYISNINGQGKGWGVKDKILFKPGENIIGFAVHPFFYDLKPTDPNEKFDPYNENIYYWVKFNAEKNKQYNIKYYLEERDNHSSNLLINIFDSDNGNISSKPIGVAVNIPNNDLLKDIQDSKEGNISSKSMNLYINVPDIK